MRGLVVPMLAASLGTATAAAPPRLWVLRGDTLEDGGD